MSGLAVMDVTVNDQPATIRMSPDHLTIDLPPELLSSELVDIDFIYERIPRRGYAVRDLSAIFDSWVY